MKVLVVYGSTHGHTARVAERIAERVRAAGFEVSVTGRPSEADVGDFDAVVVGARVHGSRYPWKITRFIRRQQKGLSTRPSAFFSVSLLQLSRSERQRSVTASLPERILPKLAWKPDVTAVIGGALCWRTQYGILTPLFKRLWRGTLGEQLDITQPLQVFTDWGAVDHFTDAFLRVAAGQLDSSFAAGDRITSAQESPPFA